MSDKLSDLEKWFWDFSAFDFERYAEEAKTKQSLTWKEIKLLSSLQRLHYKGELPSEKQLRYLKDVINKHKDQNNSAPKVHNYHKKSLVTKMAEHMTVRMAWHDNEWNGHICKSPAKNDYCVGEYSLLSARLRHSRDLNYEKSEQPIDAEKNKNKYIPPCFWSINAFSQKPYQIEHKNPVIYETEKCPPIQENLPANSVFTWPFKLSFNRANQNWKDGKYPANLEGRIQNYKSKFTSRKSVIFLYANYDNPVSSDEQQYLLIGCSLLKDWADPLHFKISPERLEKQKQKKGQHNFPTINWGIRLSLDEESSIRLPYHEYLAYAEQSNNYDYLNEMKVVISEPELIPSFKYVSMNIDDDQAIFLLTKLRKSLFIIKKHALNLSFDTQDAQDKVNHLLESCWNHRGHFPGFGNLAQLIIGREKDELCELASLPDELKTEKPKSYHKTLFEIVHHPDQLSTVHKEKYSDELEDLLWKLKKYNLSPTQFLQLSLLNLTYNQFDKILNRKVMQCPIDQVVENLYLIYEDYPHPEESEIDDRILGDKVDGVVELFKIDIALFPDTRFLKRFSNLQNIHPSDSKRLRSLILDYLMGLEFNTGDCFDKAWEIEEHIQNYPLFYESNYTLPDQFLRNLDEESKQHFSGKLTLVENGTKYYYVKDIYQMEERIGEYIKSRLRQRDLDSNYSLDPTESVETIALKYGNNFPKEEYLEERKWLYSHIFQKPFFVISGAPGTGKSYELLTILEKLIKNDESYLLLTPTGKAALRLRQNEENISGIHAQTIDKFINDRTPPKSIENLIIDEMSMVDLRKFDSMLKKLEDHHIKPKRLILVGDKNQLPPIGFGKIFVDIIEWINGHSEYSKNIVILDVNFRQKSDPKIIQFSKIFTGESKHYEALAKEIASGKGQVSKGIYLGYWSNREELRHELAVRFQELYKNEFGEQEIYPLKNKVLNFDPAHTTVKDLSQLTLEKFQIISPYRAGYFGTLGLNLYFQKFSQKPLLINSLFKSGDKIIRTQNLYENKELKLSNGSIGLAVGDTWGKSFFPEISDFINLRQSDEEKIELAYAITVHKSQGSGFEHLFLVVPPKMNLLSRELLYTALTRSKKGISIFIYGEPKAEFKDTIFEQIRNVSHVATRKTTLLNKTYWDYSYTPAEGKNVKSRIEYLLYKKLEASQEEYAGEFTFEYEEELVVEGENFNISPDFRIKLKSGKIIYWEHLGQLGKRSYQRDWNSRLPIYQKQGFIEQLVTTDEKNGISDQKIDEIIFDIITDDIQGDITNSSYSNHHYSLA